jgi:predicted metal-dependent hydrolase
MEGVINQNISYTVRKSTRAKRLRISVSCEGRVIVTVPRLNYWGTDPSSKLAEDFVRKKWGWVKKTLTKFATWPDWQKKKYTHQDYLDNKKKARDLVLGRLEHFNQFYGLNWGRISIRSQKSRWGSCSRAKNLNFNYKLLWLPVELQDYIIVHELCHLAELNHSKRFWALVARIIPEYHKLRRQLRGKVG